MHCDDLGIIQRSCRVDHIASRGRHPAVGQRPNQRSKQLLLRQTTRTAGAKRSAQPKKLLLLFNTCLTPRRTSAAMVSVGFATADVGKTLLPRISRLGCSWA